MGYPLPLVFPALEPFVKYSRSLGRGAENPWLGTCGVFFLCVSRYQYGQRAEALEVV